MANKTTGYLGEAKEAAADMVREFIDQVVEQLIDKGEASDDYANDYAGGDSYHHETHVDSAYSLTEAAEILDELHRYEETDNGLWEGLAPRDAISAQAAYTYGAAVGSMWSDLIKEINADDDIAAILAAHAEREEPQEDDNGDEVPPSAPTLPAWVQAWLARHLSADVNVALAKPLDATDREMLRDELRHAGHDSLCKLVTDGSVSADIEQRIKAILKG